MGPAGCGKSTVAAALSDQTGWPMIEADDHHSQANIQKQAAGTPLNDDDRKAWVDAILHAARLDKSNEPLILACSALTPYVQNRLVAESQRACLWFLLTVSADTLATRLKERENHFMPASLLGDQLKALAPPENAISIDAERPVEIVCADIRSSLSDKA